MFLFFNRGFLAILLPLLLLVCGPETGALAQRGFQWNTDVWAGRLGFAYLWLTTQGANWTDCHESSILVDPCSCRRVQLEPEASWVRCNRQGKIQELHLSDNNLVGNFPRIALELLLSSGVTLIDISNNSLLDSPQPCVLLPRCLIPNTECLFSPTKLCDLDGKPEGGGNETSISPSTAPTELRRRLQDTAPTESEATTSPSAASTGSTTPSIAPSIAPSWSPSWAWNRTNITVSGGYGTNDSVCAPWFTDNTTGIVYHGCEANFTPPLSPYVDSEEPFVEPTWPVTNETWCYIGNSTIYDPLNETEERNWAFCKSWWDNTTTNESWSPTSWAPTSSWAPTVVPSAPPSTGRLLQNGTAARAHSTFGLLVAVVPLLLLV